MIFCLLTMIISGNRGNKLSGKNRFSVCLFRSLQTFCFSGRGEYIAGAPGDKRHWFFPFLFMYRPSRPYQSLYGDEPI